MWDLYQLDAINLTDIVAEKERKARHRREPSQFHSECTTIALGDVEVRFYRECDLGQGTGEQLTRSCLCNLLVSKRY